MARLRGTGTTRRPGVPPAHQAALLCWHRSQRGWIRGGSPPRGCPKASWAPRPGCPLVPLTPGLPVSGRRCGGSPAGPTRRGLGLLLLPQPRVPRGAAAGPRALPNLRGRGRLRVGSIPKSLAWKGTLQFKCMLAGVSCTSSCNKCPFQLNVSTAFGPNTKICVGKEPFTLYTTH